MKTVIVQAFEDRNRSEGGHAVILLAGLREVPSRPAFRLRPAGLAGHADLPDAWPEGEQMPISARVTADGVELVVGPDLAEHPMLPPGTAVEIAVSDADLQGEFLWPSVQPVARPKRRSILLRTQQRDEWPEVARHSDRPASPSVGRPPGADARQTEPSRLNGAGLPAAVQRTDSPRPVLVNAVQVNTGALNAGLPHGGLANRIPANGEHPVMNKEPTAMPDSHSHAAPAAPALPNGVAATFDAPATAKREPTEFVTFYPHARGGRLKADKPYLSFPTSRLATAMPTSPAGIAAAIVAGVVLVQAAILMLQPGSGKGQAAVPAVLAAPAGETTAHAPVADDVLFEALVSGATSPRGASARETGSVRSLEKAQAALAGTETARDTDEGAFWIKRYLQVALGEDRTLRALTHLGSTYAEPAGRVPDYTKARLVWELAGALGDPVAMCLLGVMHENGLGVARDKQKALPWFERAKKAGGCPDIDESLARARQ